MNALICHAFGDPPDIRLSDSPVKEPGPHEVIIDVRYAALNFTDALMMQGLYQDKPQTPFVPGLDAAGTVSAVGAAVSRWRVGDVVVASGVAGAYAQRIVAHQDRLVAVPATLDPASAVASINSHLTAYHGLVDRADLAPGETLLVLGASGAVGQAALQIGRLRQARVIAVVRSPEQAKAARALGADHCVVTSTEDLKTRVREITDNQGVDVAIDPLGGPTFETALRLLKWRGRMLVVGFAAGEIPKVPVNLTLLKGCSIVGVYCGRLLTDELPVFTRQLGETLELIASDSVAPTPTEIFAPADFASAWQKFRDHANRRKVLFRFG